MIPDKITTHETEAPKLLTDQFKGRPVVEGLVKIAARRAQKLEDIVWTVIEGHLLDDAIGKQLDTLGAIAGEKRNGRADERYRFAIRVRIRVNRSQGRAIDVIEVARMLDPAATYLEFFPLAWEVDIFDTPYGGDFARLLAQAKGLTSYGVLVTSTWPVEEVSVFTDAGGPTLEDDVFESAV